MPRCVRIALCLATGLLASTSFAQQPAASSVPNLIRYSGTLKGAEGRPVSSTTPVGVTFAIYKQQDGGAPIWQETQNVTPDANGQYSVLLGTTTAAGLPDDLFSEQEQRWLGIQLAGESEQARVLMVSVPYAFKAHEAETLGGLPASAFALAPQSGVANETNSSNSAPYDGGQRSGRESTGQSNRGFTTGRGSPGYIPVWRTPTLLGDSVMFQSQNKVGIGTTTPAAKFEVDDDNNPGYFALSGTTSNSGEVGTYGNNLASSGSGIGTAGHTLSPTGFGVYGFHDSTIGAGVGVSGLTKSSSGVGVLGIANTPSGLAVGVSGASASVDGVGVVGLASSAGAQGHSAFGVTGQSYDPNGAGGSFADLASSGHGTGVSAVSDSNNGTGVYGVGVGPSNIGQKLGNATTVGVWGDSGNGVGVFATADDATALVAVNNSNTSAALGGSNQSTSGSGASGVLGITASNDQNASGVVGEAASTTGNVNGVYGVTVSTNGNSDGVYGQATATSGGANGVEGVTSAPNGYGVWGKNNSGSSGGHGVVGTSTGGAGVVGFAGFSNVECCTNGVVGQNMATTGHNNGGELATSSPGGVGGIFTNSGGGLSILARVNDSQNSFWVDGGGNGWFNGGLTVNGNGTFGPTQINGDLQVNGTLSKQGGMFKIDDPLDPANKYLSHSFVESPDMMNIYNGSVKLNAHGEAWVTMPRYFEALNRDCQYMLTAIGRPQPYLYVAKKMSGNRFKIAGGKPNAEVSWQVTGIRQDAWANAHRIPNEEDKPVEERGHYLHPELFGATPDKNVSARLNMTQR